MTVTPDTQQEPTEPTEQEEALYEAVATVLEDVTGHHRDAYVAAMLEALAKPIADLQRHAAADALRRKAKSFDNTARMFRDMSRKPGIDHESSTIYWVHSTQARTDADALRKEADGIIAEGYEYECQECDTPVPDAGDLCEQHDVDDEDKWSE